MNSFTKVGADWCAKITSQAVTGDVATINTRAGGTKQVTLGAFLFTDSYGNRVFKIAEAPRRAAEDVGNLSGIVAVFATASRHLRHPSIVLDGFRVSVAGARSRNPGSLKVTGIDADVVSRFGGMTRKWFGSVSLAGVFQPGQAAPEGLGEKLRAFAANPAGEAARHGRLTGRCCFCNHRLGEGDDRRSVEIGYGPDCAEHFGLPWGTRAAREVAAARSAPVVPEQIDAVPLSQRERQGSWVD
jgi:hypothetical protein